MPININDYFYPPLNRKERRKRNKGNKHTFRIIKKTDNITVNENNNNNDNRN